MTDWFYALLVPDGKLATKSYQWQGDRIVRSSEYSAGKLFMAIRSPEFSNIDGLADALRKVELSKSCFIIRGELATGEMRRANVNRRYHQNDPHTLPDWDARDRRWAMLDIDNIAWTGPEIVSQAEYEAELVKTIKTLLPACFHDVSFYYQLSSSAGLTKTDDGSYRVGHSTLKVHLWYWLDRPLCCPSIKEYIRNYNLPVDCAPFSPVQPHYMAHPIFENGNDPLTFRSGLVRGTSGVLVLPSSVLDRDAYIAQKKKPRSSTMTYAKQARRGKGLIEKAANEILGTGEGQGRHQTLNKAGYTLGGCVAAGSVGYDDAYNAITQAGVAVGISYKEAHRIARNSMEKGMMIPLELRDNQLESAPPVMLGSAVALLGQAAQQPDRKGAEVIEPKQEYDHCAKYVQWIKDSAKTVLASYASTAGKRSPKTLHWHAVCEHIDLGDSILLAHLPAFSALVFGADALSFTLTAPRSTAERAACERIITGEHT
jgi:hypothetical protein